MEGLVLVGPPLLLLSDEGTGAERREGRVLGSEPRLALGLDLCFILSATGGRGD